MYNEGEMEELLMGIKDKLKEVLDQLNERECIILDVELVVRGEL